MFQRYLLFFNILFIYLFSFCLFFVGALFCLVGEEMCEKMETSKCFCLLGVVSFFFVSTMFGNLAGVFLVCLVNFLTDFPFLG